MKYGSVESEKLYFSSSEAAEQVGVSTSILHSWEKDFPELKPKKSGAGKRLYRMADIETAKKIKEIAPQATPQAKQPRQTKQLAAINPINTGNTDNKEPNKEILLDIRERLLNVLNRIKG